ncbi:uncharacterized protein LOC106136529 [Amyelois transitella]|uniref:uncharacterized protein LOC106136529 n=1 Tax=Amyelois transitella TaxID=680683 RepID=UPI00067E3839|nr:uncharacterized protein LOC106136529 [Amyelois transitella]
MPRPRRDMDRKKMFHEKLDLDLIRLVKANEVLYDFNHPKYMDFNAREVAWQMIGDELKRPAADCKLRWINIRDVNRRILRKKLITPQNRGRLYKYENELTFMRPFYRDVNIQSCEFESDDKSEQNWNDDNDNGIDDTAMMDENNDSDEMEKPVKKEVRTKKKCSKRKKKRTYEEEDDDDEEDELPIAASINETTATTTEGFDPADPVDAFLISIGATLKTFTPYHLNLAKSKIFAVVQEHDLQQIVQKTNDVSVKQPETLYLS